jgi:hypothetical protein
VTGRRAGRSISGEQRRAGRKTEAAAGPFLWSCSCARPSLRLPQARNVDSSPEQRQGEGGDEKEGHVQSGYSPPGQQATTYSSCYSSSTTSTCCY